MDDISERIAETRGRMEEAARQAGRDPGEVELMVVSKTFPPEVIEEAVAARQRLFGESRVQEAVTKIPRLPSSLRWHFIGHLQSNKVRKILPLIEAIHSVDSVELALDIERIADELGLHPEVYLQVNVASDGRKFGFRREGLLHSIDQLLTLKRVQVVGLMTIPPLSPKPEESRPHFAALRRLRDEIHERTGTFLPGLSMGMSGDFPYAIAEGATIVRVGSAIFGAR